MNNTLPFIHCDNLVKIYKVAGLEVVALQGLDLTVRRGEMLGIIGSSGSGKSTLLNILGGLDRPSAGRISVGGQNLLKASDAVLDAYRRDAVGFVWQQTARNLVPYLTAQQNVDLPLTISGVRRQVRRERVQMLLESVGLWEQRTQRLAQLSGGQQQRVAIAVALANEPELLLADEPTGELDSATADDILTLLQRLNRELQLTTVIVTHDPQLAQAVDRVVTIRDGRLSSESVRRQETAVNDKGDHVAASTADAANGNATRYDEFVVVDAVGRLQLPAALREQAGIDQRVVVETTEKGILIRPAAKNVSASGGNTPVAQAPAPPSGRRRWWPWRKKES